MNLTITLTDEQFSIIKDSLRISQEQFKKYLNTMSSSQGSYISDQVYELVGRILKARKALDLSNSDSSACHDYVPPELSPCSLSF